MSDKVDQKLRRSTRVSSRPLHNPSVNPAVDRLYADSSNRSTAGQSFKNPDRRSASSNRKRPKEGEEEEDIPSIPIQHVLNVPSFTSPKKLNNGKKSKKSKPEPSGSSKLKSNKGGSFSPNSNMVVMSETADQLQGYVSEPDEELTGASGDKLILYSSQKRMAELILRKTKDIIGPDYQISEINQLFIGPAATDIRDQTAKDLEIVYYHTLRASMPPLKCKQMAKSYGKKVKNSSSLFQGSKADEEFSEEVKDFFDAIEEDTENSGILHILFHDEAHWGIEKDSNISKLLNALANIRAAKPFIKFVMIQVSATPDVLTCAADEDIPVLHWTPSASYKRIEEIQIVNDSNPSLTNQTNLGVRSEVVATQYETVMEAWMNHIRNPQDANYAAALKLIQAKYPVTYDALKSSVMENISHEDALENTASYQEATHPRNKCLIIRLDGTKHANSLETKLKAILGNNQPFEILNFVGSKDPIMSDRAGLQDNGPSKYLGANQHRHKAVSVANMASLLHGIPTIILVVDRMSMGARIPLSTAVFDLRARYSGASTSISTNQSTFIQDVGRLAGHKETDAKVLVAFSDGFGNSTNNVNEFGWVRLHNLLDCNYNYSKSFPIETFQAFKNCTIIIRAPPQIGKTGALAALLQKLHILSVNK